MKDRSVVMQKSVTLVSGASLIVLLAGCPAIVGIDNDYTFGGVPHPDGGGVDSGSIDGHAPDGAPLGDGAPHDHTTSSDSGPKDTGLKEVGPAPDVEPPDACPSSCPVTVSSGWTLVAFNAAGTTACPDDFSQAEVVEITGTASCTCGSCAVTAQPDCETGNVSSTWNESGGSVCDGTGGYFPATGVCVADAIGNATWVSYTGPGPTAGSCTASPTANNPSVQQEILCTPTTGCANDACEPGLGSAFQTCLYQAGDQPCPTGTTTKHSVGASVNTSCGTCGCSVSAAGCSGTMALYSNDTGCPGSPFIVVPANGTCTNLVGVQNGDSYIYTASPVGVSCAPGTATATPSLTSQGTVCCP
jgi:hypothetical protein